MVNKPDIIEELRGLFDTWHDSQPHIANVAIRAIDEIVKLRNPRFRQRANLTFKTLSNNE